jgi:DNA-binding transcriptional LysR family regulator
MKINHLGLSAFYQCALKQNMTEASAALGVTQSALSQRIASLEDDLETTLFVREAKALRLTAQGQELLDYCHFHTSLEDEILSKFKGDQDDLAGIIRIGAYSSVSRSIVLPRIASLLRQNPKLLLDLNSYEVHELHGILKSNGADIIITDHHINQKGICEHVLGMEEYVVIQGAKYKSPEDIYFDHDVDDDVTEEFFSKQLHPPKSLRRAFMGDVYGIIDAVERGLGRAVISKHLIDGNKKVKILPNYKKVDNPIVICYLERPYYSKAFKDTLKVLRNE